MVYSDWSLQTFFWIKHSSAGRIVIDLILNEGQMYRAWDNENCILHTAPNFNMQIGKKMISWKTSSRLEDTIKIYLK